MLLLARLKKNLPFIICFAFFLAYATLSIIRHMHYGSYGFDLGIADQIAWNYSQFDLPVNTIYHWAFTHTFTDHIEFIYIFIAPFYWLFSDVKTLLILQALVVTASGIPVYLLAKRKGIHPWISLALLISYLMFYGIQNSLWFDVHSLSFAAGFLPWFLYFLDKNYTKWTIIFFLLSIACKEDIALFTFVISFIYFLTTKRKITIFLMLASVLYLLLIFFVYFPYFTESGYRFSNTEGLLSNLQMSYFIDTEEKRKVIFYSLAWFGFLPLTAPLYLLPGFTDTAHYFILGHNVPTAQTFFMHYRVTLALFLVWPAIIAIKKNAVLNNKFIAVYILLVALLLQYILHLPLSYLTKPWFWTEPSGVRNIEKVIQTLPRQASVVSQNNITPHVSQRKVVLTLWPEKKSFSDSPCGKTECDWFRWSGRAEYLIVDTSPEWDIRHLLTNPSEYKNGLENMEKAGYINKAYQSNTAVLYRVLKHP